MHIFRYRKHSEPYNCRTAMVAAYHDQSQYIMAITRMYSINRLLTTGLWSAAGKETWRTWRNIEQKGSTGDQNDWR